MGLMRHKRKRTFMAPDVRNRIISTLFLGEAANENEEKGAGGAEMHGRMRGSPLQFICKYFFLIYSPAQNAAPCLSP